MIFKKIQLRILKQGGGILPLATRQGRSGDAAASFSSSGSDMGSALREGERERERERESNGVRCL